MQHVYVIDQYDCQSDATLVRLVCAGEREAFGPLLLRHYASVLRLCQRLLGDTLAAQDVAQEAALAAFLRLHDLHDPERFGAWLHAIAANLARMALRRKTAASLEQIAPDRGIVLWAERMPTPEEAYAAREIHDAVVAALNELSHVNRAAVTGFYLEGYTYAELAELLGVPVSAVRGRLSHGRKQLRQRLLPLANELLHLDTRKEEPVTAEQPNLVAMTVSAIRGGNEGDSNLVVLRERDGERELPIFIGPPEANAISVVLQGLSTPRPMTHDLTMRLLESLDAQVAQVVIHDLVNQVFYAQVQLLHNNQTQVIDARPSDALALAVRCDAPIFTTQALLEAAQVPTDEAGRRERDAAAQQMLREQLAQRAQPPQPPPFPTPAPPEAEAQRQVDASLDRFLSDTHCPTVLLRHRSGALVGRRGTGDAEKLSQYSLAVASNDEDLINLLRFELYPAVEGIVVLPVRQHTFLEFGLPPGTSEAQHTMMIERAGQTVSEIAALLPEQALADGVF